ncbi:MAG: hypothetical protein IPH46_17410 [Bacteroidetes bacterium]|nr:hypothetical protein [Bacteroidota bacterium]
MLQTGPDASNRVLLGQFTTTGAFGYHINLVIGTPTPGVSETWLPVHLKVVNLHTLV